MISIVVADDHAIVREGLRRLLDAEHDLEVIGEAEDGREVLTEVGRQRPDIVVLDITMPKMGGLETLERLRTDHENTKVILLSVHNDRPSSRARSASGPTAMSSRTDALPRS